MANKNRNLILSYFSDEAAANEAAQAMKEWDKERKEIKLGGMGVITMDEDGKLNTHKVGKRAGGTGAKWGFILGAAAGILSGGITLVGGAIAGLAAGAVSGSLFHKRLGMSDDDQMRLQMNLKEGGAALAVMVDDEEMEPTRSKLNSLGGDVEHYIVPDETMEELEETAVIEDVDDGEIVIVETVEGDDLVRVDGIGPKYAELLEAADVGSLSELAGSDAAELSQKVAEVNQEKNIVKELPSEQQLSDWIAQANELT